MMLSEIIDLSRPFEKSVKKTLKKHPDKNKITGHQLHEYFKYKCIKLDKKRDGSISINLVYEHKESGEEIVIENFIEINENEKGLYKNYTDKDYEKYVRGQSSFPNNGTNSKILETEYPFTFRG